MTPQFVDFDFDGITDMVVGTFEGTGFWVPGTADGFQQPEYIKDAQDRNVQLANFWNRPERKWDKADRSPPGKKNPDHHCTSVVAVDWDEDGDLDLLLGAYRAGALYVQFNEGTAKEPKYTGENHPVTAGDGDFIVPGGMASMRQIDFDGDGQFDLVCGSKQGGVYFFKNEGATGAPKFAAPVTLVEPPGDEPVKVVDGMPTRPQTGFHIDVVDYDGDDDLDLLVGGYSTWTPEQKELTDEQRTQLAELEKETDETRTKLNAVRDAILADVDRNDPDAARAAAEKVEASAEFQELIQQYIKLRGQLGDRNPTSRQRKSLVWLYRQQ